MKSRSVSRVPRCATRKLPPEKRENAVIDHYLCAESGQAGGRTEVRSRESTEQWSVCEEEFTNQGISRTRAVVEIGIELFFPVSGEGCSGDSAVGILRRRNQKL